jgi:hypothetical protein
VPVPSSVATEAAVIVPSLTDGQIARVSETWALTNSRILSLPFVRHSGRYRRLRETTSVKCTTFGCWALLGLSACTFKLDVHTTGEAVEPDGGGDAGLDGEASDDAPSHDASRPGPQEDQDAMVYPELVQHPACSIPFGRYYVFDPNPSTSDPTGRPAFDFWRDLPCESVADYPLCSPGHLVRTASYECSTCLLLEGDAGVCAGSSYTESELFTFREGACGGNAPAAAKARACCAGTPGVDCRSWPFELPSKPGEVCVRHLDCEPGLQCKVGFHTAGRCLCPEVDINTLQDPPDCSLQEGAY